MTRELQSTLEASAIQWPVLKNDIPCMALVIQLALGAFMNSLGVKGHNKCWEAHERDQGFEENESIDIGKSQRLRKEGNVRINMVLAMKAGLAKTIGAVRISWYFGSPEIDLHIAENACCIDYTDTWLSKQVQWLSKSESSHRGTTNYACEDMGEPNNGIAGTRLPIMVIHTWVAPQSGLHWLLATFHNSKWVDQCEVCHEGIEAISILDPVIVKEAYSHIASRYHNVQRHVRSHGWRDVSFGQEEDSMEGILVLRCDVSSTEAVQILRWCDSNDRHAADFWTYPRFFLEVVVV